MDRISRWRAMGILICSFSVVAQVRAAQILRAQVSVQTSLYAPDASGRLVPAQRAAVGDVLQVSDTVRNGWRQVVVRSPGVAPRWGWVPERDLRVSDATSIGAAKVSPMIGSAQEAKAGVEPSRDPKTKKNESLTLGIKGGILLSLASTGTSVTPQFGSDLGVRIVGDRSGALFLELDSLVTWAVLSQDVGGITYSLFGLDSLSRIYVLGRNLFRSGLYVGGGAGVQVSVATLTASDGSVSQATVTPFFAFGAKVGYDIRPVPLFSFGPEIHYNGVLGSAGVVSSFSFLGDVRFHF